MYFKTYLKNNKNWKINIAVCILFSLKVTKRYKFNPNEEKSDFIQPLTFN